MTTKEIINLELGTKVFLIHNAEISAWQTIGFHPKYKQYFYLVGNGSVENTKCLFLGGGNNHSTNNLHWETDYDKAKEVMWKQLKHKVKSINQVYMDSKESLNFEENPVEYPLRGTVYPKESDLNK